MEKLSSPRISIALMVGIAAFSEGAAPVHAQSSPLTKSELVGCGAGDWVVILQPERSGGKGEINGYLFNSKTGEAFFLSNGTKRAIREEKEK